MPDEQYAALSAKLDAILARLEKLEERPVTLNIQTALPAPNSAQVKQMVDVFEQELGKRVRKQAPGYNNGGVF